MHLYAEVVRQRPYVGHRHPRPVQQRDGRDEFLWHLPILDAQVVPELPPARAPVRLLVPVFAVVYPVAGVILALAFWAPHLLFFNHYMLGGGGFGRYGQQLLHRRDVLAPAPPPRGVVLALARGPLKRHGDPVPLVVYARGGHVPSVAAQGLDLAVLLAYAESAARDRLLRHLASPAVLGPHVRRYPLHYLRS